MNAGELLRCSRCGAFKPDAEFALGQKVAGRRFRAYVCRSCQADYYRRYRAQPGECVECDAPTPSRDSRFCDACRPGPRERTECKRGHRFTEANTYWRPDGSRCCRACGLARTREYQGRLRASRAKQARSGSRT